MARFEIGDEVAYPVRDRYHYGRVVAYQDPENVVIALEDEYGETGELLVKEEMYLRPADDLDPAELEERRY